MSPERHAIARPGDVLLGKYRIDRVIGQGGMGFVVEAWHVQFDERIAIKFLLPDRMNDEEAVARFEREARVLFKIKSEHVCRVIDFGRLPSGLPYMVMDFLEGRDLAEVLSEQGRVPVETAVDYALQICSGLAEAHVRGIVHRDLKPENLFVCRGAGGEPCVTLLDFGLSKVDGDEDHHAGGRKRQLTSQQQVMGTPNYMSPEQWTSSKDVGAASDQWAVGTILYELVTGEVPFHGDKLAKIFAKVMSAETPSVVERCPQAPAGLEFVLRKCLDKEPARRYENVGALAVALSAFAPPGNAERAERTLAMLRNAPDRSEQVKTLVYAGSPTSDGEEPTRRVGNLGRFRAGIDAITSTSWQRMLRRPGGTRVTLTAVAIAVAVLLVIVGVATLSSNGADSDAASHAVPQLEPPMATPISEVTQEPSSAPAPEDQPAVAMTSSSSVPSMKARPQAGPTSTASQPTTAKSTTPRSAPSTTAPPVNKPGMFDNR